MATYKLFSDGETRGEIIEDSKRKITRIYDNKYKIRDFFKYSKLEGYLWCAEVPISMAIYVCAVGIFGASRLESEAYGLIPQALTYVSARATELFCRDKSGFLGKTARKIRRAKWPIRIAEKKVELKT